MKKFEAVDFYDIDSLLTEEEKLTRNTIREFVDKEFLPVVAAHNRAGTFPTDLNERMGELGIFGANLEGYGCAGLNNACYGLMMQELERGDSGLRSFATVQGTLSMYPIYAFGSDEQKERWLPRLASAEALGCFGLTEPDFGSDPGGMRTTAKRAGKDFILNGTKGWITNGSVADVSVVWAKLDGKIRGFLVEKGTPGFSARDIKGKFSMRASITSELALEDAKVPGSSLLPGTEGLKSALACLSQARFGIAWGAIGAAMACFDEALNYAKERIVFKKPIASYQLVQQKLAVMLTEITKAQLLAYRVARLKDEGKADSARISMAKMNNVNIALDIARAARDMLGANGIIDEYQVGRHLCNLETVKTYEGTHDIHLLILGRKITGIDAFS